VLLVGKNFFGKGFVVSEVADQPFIGLVVGLPEPKGG